MIEKNVGGTDRLARAVLGVALLLVAVWGIVSGRRLVGTFAGVAGAGLLFNATTQFCGLNALLGIDTCSTRSRE